VFELGSVVVKNKKRVDIEIKIDNIIEGWCIIDSIEEVANIIW
jgi:hypothetical protein